MTALGRLEHLATVARMRRTARRDRRSLQRLMDLHPGVEIHSDAASALGTGTYHLYEGARMSIGAGVVTERRPDGLRIMVRSGGELIIEEGTWLRSDLGPVVLSVYEGARLHIGPDGFLNGCQISAKAGVTLDRGCWVGPGSRIWDSDQHDLDADRPESPSPVTLGRHVWVASDVTVLKGLTIGEQSVVGARALVTKSIPAHSLALGAPAQVRGRIGDRTRVQV